MKVQVDFRGGQTMFSPAQLRQLEFAIMLGTNNTGKDIGRAYRRSEKKLFPRSTRPKRVKVKKGSKKNPVVHVGVVRGKRFTRRRKIPIITRAEAEKLKRTKRYYGNRVFEMVGRGGTLGLFVREGRSRNPIDMTHVIEEEKRKNSRAGGLPSDRLRRRAQVVGNRRAQANFEAAMRFALRTAK